MNPEAINFIVLFGKTGCGKSDILHHMEDIGEQVLHLEDFAGHSGSAFGGLHGKAQPDQDSFFKQIESRLESFDPKIQIWVEYEGSYIGKLQLPEPLNSRIRQSDLIHIKMCRDLRISRIIDEYAQFGVESLLASATKLKKHMSGKKYHLLRKSIKNEDYNTAVSVLLSYYDRIYLNGMKAADFKVIGELELLSERPGENARQIINYYHELHKSRNPA